MLKTDGSEQAFKNTVSKCNFDMKKCGIFQKYISGLSGRARLYIGITFTLSIDARNTVFTLSETPKTGFVASRPN